jgi:hypothetical protein
MKNGAGLHDPLFILYREKHSPLLDKGDLFVRVIVRRGDDARGNAQPANHQPVADDHLPLYPLADILDGNIHPVVLPRKDAC